MDKSWRMRMGSTPPMSGLPHRRSTEQYPSNQRPSVFASDSEALEPEDFADVFGGPPRSVFWRKMSGDFSAAAASTSSYEEIFRPPEILHSGGEIGGRGLPAFRIPGTSDGFYRDVFRIGSDFSVDERSSRDRSRPKSKSTSSSVLSSEEMSPLWPGIAEHVTLSDFASKLRSLNVPCRRNHSSTTTMHANETSSRKQSIPTFYGNRPSYAEHHFMGAENNWNFGRSHFGFSRRVSSPETISLKPDSYPSVKISAEDDVELNSPSSPVSSLCHESTDYHAKSESHEGHVVEEVEELDQEEEEEEEEEEDDDDEVMSSYVVEIGSDHREGACDAVGIDEAIAWAKQKFQTHSSEKILNKIGEDIKESPKMDAGTPNVREFPEQEMKNKIGLVQSPEMEMRLQDENIRLWSAGKETDIRLLLLTLHYILWPNSGWSAIPPTSLIESSQVKKAYQKARLCLYPDKLQQRGAALSQKYVADKAFRILQDAWASFISQDVSSTG